MRTKLLLLAVATARLCLAEDLVLENDFASFVFSEANGFALSSVTDRRTGTVFRFDLTKDPSLWAMTPMRPEHNTLAKRQSAPSPTGHVLKGNSATFTWPDATLTVTLPPASGIAEWRFSWHGNGAWPYSFEFPYVRVTKVGEADRLYYPQRLGKVLEDPVGREFSVIPISPNWWSAQYAVYSASPTAPRTRSADPKRTVIDGSIRGPRADESSLYLSPDDPAYWRKCIVLSGKRGSSSFPFGIEHFPPWAKRPERPGDAKGAFDWTCPYVVRFGVVRGGVDAAVTTYREQTKKEYASERKTSRFLLQRPAWRSNHVTPAEMAGLARTIRDYYRVPAVLHHYEATLERFNWHFPEFRSYREGFREENEYLRSIDCRAMPYGNVVRFDRTLSTYPKVNGDTVAIRDINGAMRGDPFKGVPDTLAAWGDRTWTEYHRRMVRELFAKVGVGGYYMDEGCGSARLDYDPAHGGIHGGTYVSDGFRRFSRVLREEARKFDPDGFLVTEGFGEHLIGEIDAFLVYGLKEPSGLNAHASGFDHFPLFSLALHDRTIGVSDHPRMASPDDYFRLFCAQGWVWGLQVQALARGELEGVNVRKAEYTREIVRASWQVGAKYFATGESLFTAIVTNAAEIGTAPIGAVSESCDVPYFELPWKGPSVMAGAFRDAASGDCALALANLKDTPRDVRVLRDPARFAPRRTKLYRSWPLPVTELAPKDDFTLSVPANGVMLLEWRDDPPQPRELLSAPAPLPKWAEKVNAQVASGESARTYLAEFVPGTLCVTDKRKPGLFETAMLVDNHDRKPLEVTLEPGGTYRLPPLREARLPISVTTNAGRDTVTVPVCVLSPAARPREETLRFGVIGAMKDNEVACLKRPLKYPVAGVPHRLPFTVTKGAKEFSFYPGVFGDVMGVIRDPGGKVAVWRKVSDEFLGGTRYAIDVPAGTDGRQWTYQHVAGKACIAFGDGVEPIDRSVLGDHRAPAPYKGLGFEGAENRLEVRVPDRSKGDVWSERFHMAFHGKWPETQLRCDFPKPVSGHVSAKLAVKTSGGCMVRGFLQAFIPRTGGTVDVVATPAEEQKVKKGRTAFAFAGDFTEPVASVELVLRFTGAKKYELEVLGCERD